MDIFTSFMHLHNGTMTGYIESKWSAMGDEKKQREQR